MNKLLSTGAGGLLLAALSFAAPVLAAAPSAQVFEAVGKPEALDPQWRARLCALLPQPCNAQLLNLHRPRGAASGDYVALSVEPLAMARVRRSAEAGGWQLDRLHDFTAHAQALKKEDPERADAPLSLAPALYPLAEGQWAVAVLQLASESYSGGGASFRTASFVPLDGGAAVHKDIPFSCSRMVRACFSEKEYKTSKHCHDESWGSLRIAYAYAEAAKPGGPYDWRYTWLQSEWPQDQPRSATTTTRIQFTDKTTERADFCGGGPQ